jgi:hypothetical protein
MTTQQTALIDVTWDAERGGRLICRCEDNPTLSSNVIEWPTAITASTDSWEVANAAVSLAGVEIISVEHDKDTVFVTVDDSRDA